jgi:phosphoenolpyruvate synthase/pyruvate phosphate dikinase
MLMTDRSSISGGVTVEGQAFRRYRKRKIKKELRRALKGLEKDLLKEVDRVSHRRT